MSTDNILFCGEKNGYDKSPKISYTTVVDKMSDANSTYPEGAV